MIILKWDERGDSVVANRKPPAMKLRYAHTYTPFPDDNDLTDYCSFI